MKNLLYRMKIVLISLSQTVGRDPLVGQESIFGGWREVF